MDLSTLTPQKNTYKTVLKDPRDLDKTLEHDGTEMYIERYLPHTKEYKEVQYKKTQKYLKAAQAKKGADVDIDLMEAEVDRVEVMSATVVDWKIYYGGEWLEFSKEKALELFTEAFWLIEQLQDGENEADVFTKD